VGKQKLNYHLFSDSAGAFAKSMGISFQAPNHYLKLINESSLGRNKESIPVPSLFVVNTKQEILFEHIQPNFKNRISSKLLLSVLEALK
jgi:peroxiredoxin